MKIHSSARLIVLLTVIIFFSMISRIIFSPLVVTIQSEFGMSLAQAGSLFFIIYLAYSPAMLFSGYISARIRDKGCVVVAVILNAAGLFIAALSSSFGSLAAGLLLIGVGSGLYPSSGMTVLTGAVSPERRGFAIAVHEIGPNCALLAAPLTVLILYSRLGWRGILLILVCANLAAALLFARQNIGGNRYGKAPRFDLLKAVVKQKEAWFILGLFTAAHSALQGLYAVLPMYLVVTRGFEADMVNKLLSISRISGILLLPVSGTLADFFGARRVILTVFLVSGIATIFIAFTSGFALVFAVIAQPALITAFYPAALIIITNLGPEESRNVTYSVIISIAVFVGGGVLPIFFGALGDLGVQSIGFYILAATLLICAFFVYRNRDFGAKAAISRNLE